MSRLFSIEESPEIGAWSYQRPFATWPVAGDLLFDRVRSKPYAAVCLTVYLCEWIYYMTDLSRHVWARHTLAVWNFQCYGDRDAESFFSLNRGCSEVPIGGPIW